MKGKGDSLSPANAGREDVGLPLGTDTENIGVASPLRDKEDTLDVCRVCQCSETDKKGEAALKYLGIHPPTINGSESLKVKSLMADGNRNGVSNDAGRIEKNEGSNTNSLQHKIPEEEICSFNSTDLEAGPCLWHHDALIDLGCLCKSDLALAHYSCALRWFINRGSIVCEICGSPPLNVRLADHSKIIAALKERETLRSGTAAGEVTSAYESQPDLCADAVATARRQRLTEIASWFDPHSIATVSGQGTTGQDSDDSNDDMFLNVNTPTKWLVEGTGILVAAGLLTITLGWLIAPRVGKKTGRRVLPFLIGGLCAFTVVVFLRFGVLPRIKYGPARYWTVLLLFWFLVFGVWASSTRSSRSD